MRRISARRMRLRWAAAALTAAAVAIAAGPAAATVIGQDHYSGTNSFTDAETCEGMTFDVESTFHGQMLLRVAKGGQAFLVKDTYFFRDVWTNTATKKWFTIEGHATSHENQATLVSGNVYEFTAIEAGQPFAIVDSTGNTVVQDRGVIRRVYTFDTLGDGEPGGTFIEELATSVHGPHAGFADDFDLCGIAASLTS